VTNSGPAENTNLQPGTKVLGGRFTLERLVAAEQPDYGAPAIWHAVGVAASFIVKAWTKRGADDIAIRTIWNHEVRNLLRLDGLPRAHDHFATLEALGADDNGYFVVVDGGGRQFLAAALADRNSHDWLRRVDQLPIRAKLWSGLAKIAIGLGMLHDQGVLHRALRTECIFTDLRGECDFRLSGFEWSLRLGAAAMGSSFGTELSRIRAPELEAATPSYSVASDWFDFGLLAAEVVGGFKPSGNGLVALSELRRSVLTAGHLTEAERTLIAGLLTPNPDARRIECVEVPRRVTALATRLAADQRSFDRPLILAVHMASGGELAQAIFHLSHGTIRIDDGPAQLAFLAADISEGATVSVRSGTPQHYALHGREITYRLYKFEGSGAPTWRAAFCAGIDRGSRDPDRVESLQGRKIRVEAVAQAGVSLRDPNVRVAAWDQVAAFDSAAGNEPGSDAYDFLRFSNTVDALLTAARIWPVKIVGGGMGSGQNSEWVAVEALQDEGRDRMALALGLEPPARQLERAFFEEVGEVDGETTFNLVDEPKLLNVVTDGKWVIKRALLTDDGARRYEFQRVGGVAPRPEGDVYLRPADVGGSFKLLERRLKAIESLRNQATMLRAIESPGSVSRDTMETLPEDASIALLDDPKKQALREIWRSQPMYALQGPPGTGKTALVEAMVRRALETDPSLQFVATAQANGTVDVLGAKLSKAALLGSIEGTPIIVRLDEDDEDEKQSELSPFRLIDTMAAKLAASPLGKSAPANIAKRLTSLASGDGREGLRERSDMERLLTRAANVVLSTSTSRGLSEILDEGKRFDWCLVEEASKAHGFDLALPMLASHRMLMIGDHEQLPAFNEAVYLRLLQDPQKVVTALNNGARFISRKLGFDLGPVESDEAMQAFQARCARWHPMVRIFGHVFEESMALPAGHAAIARRLDQQHRMHPEICELVKRCFYPNLQTAEVARQRLEGPDPFTLAGGSWLPPHRIVFVDMPYVQANPKAKGQDLDSKGRMVLSSHSEAKAVIEVLGQLVPQGDCELQILAPYNRQVKVIRRELDKALEKARLPHLAGFQKPRGREEFGSTIDGFQGEEADIIVTSLVRNNHAALTGGVGFLTERPRLNVMLSRARRKLIFVGSWDFFTKRANDAAFADPAHPLHHLAIMFHEISEAVGRGSACIVAAPMGIPK
jgi:hypothetical protein